MLQNGVSALLLAPMEGVTDAPMRALLTAQPGFTFCVAEFLRISQEVPPRRVFLRHVPELSQGGRTPGGVPVQGQLLGGDPERLAEAARRFHEVGAWAVDLNFGCPAPTVNRHDGGATLLKYPHRIRAIVEAVRKAVPAHVPVSAKLRLGWDCPQAIHENADRAAEGGASWITIHGRTRMAGYAPPALWELIGEVRRRLPIPVVANGDLWTVEDVLRCRDVTGCEHFMLGRGALADPLLALRAAAALGIGAKTLVPPLGIGPQEWLPWLYRFAEVTGPRPDRSQHLTRRIKQWLKLASLRKPIPWFDTVKRAQSIEELFAIVGAVG